MKIVKSISFTATLGINQGYGHANQTQSAKETVGTVWQQAAAEVFSQCSVYIGVVVKDSKTVYNTTWGCPKGCENTAEISGVCNPQYTELNQYKEAVLQTLEKCAKVLGQETTQVVFTECELAYLDFRK